jgi:hypothetical protein
MTSRHRHHGYVLVVTLGLLLLAATMLVSLGRATLRQAQIAREAQAELQQRWGLYSCRNSILPNAEKILARREITDNKPVPTVRASVRLGEQTFDLLVSDEQAKANVNALLSAVDKSSAENRLRQALSGSGVVNNVKLRPILSAHRPAPPTTAPATQASSTQPIERVIDTYAQVFDGVAPPRLIASPAQLVTCWGPGQINVRRASTDALKLAAGSSLNSIQIQRVIDARNKLFEPGQTIRPPDPQQKPPAALAEILNTSAKTSKEHLSWTLTSNCHSLWIVARTRQREYYYLAVMDDANAGHAQLRTFLW